MGRMGLDFGLESGQYCKRKFRWLYTISLVSADGSVLGSGKSLPPLRSSRPNLTFREMPARHLIEDVYYPAKPDWKPVSLILYDLKKGTHPVFDWIKGFYNPQLGILREPNHPGNPKFINQTARLDINDGCGRIIETWIWDDVWPVNINFQELDMGSSEVLTCDIQLRYVRAYIQ